MEPNPAAGNTWGLSRSVWLVLSDLILVQDTKEENTAGV